MAATVLFSALDKESVRSSPYLAELRSFLAQYGLPVGTVETVSLLAAQLAQGGDLRDDLASMLTVVCVQEPSTSTLELLGLVLLAACGPKDVQSLQRTPGVEVPARQIFQFVVEVRRSSPAEEALADTEEQDHLTVDAEDATAWLDDEVQPVALPEPVISKAIPSADAQRPMLARALALAADEEAFGEPMRQPAPPIRPMVREAEPLDTAVPLAALATAGETGASQSKLWLVGGGGVALGLLAGLLAGPRLLSHANSAPPAVAAPAADTSASTSGTGALPRAHRGGGERPRVSAPARTAASTPRVVASAPTPSDYRPIEHAGPDARMGAAAGSRFAAAKDGSASAGSGTGRHVIPAGSSPSVVREIHLSLPAEAAASRSTDGRQHFGSVVLGSSGIMAANLVSSPAPAYPVQASAAQVQGEVVIEAVVGKAGDIVDTRVVSGPPLLREAAVNAVQQWRYRPYEVDGKPAEIATTARVDFRLDR